MPPVAMMDRAASWVSRFGDLSPRMWKSASESLMVSPTTSMAPNVENREKSMTIQKMCTSGTDSTTTSSMLKAPKASRPVLSNKDLKQEEALAFFLDSVSRDPEFFEEAIGARRTRMEEDLCLRLELEEKSSKKNRKAACLRVIVQL
ncbi:unnamed protein product [Symbiodinium sp. KB8]|nr:unnamed protein product [Symbiodinium sp. KB8]